MIQPARGGEGGAVRFQLIQSVGGGIYMYVNFYYKGGGGGAIQSCFSGREGGGGFRTIQQAKGGGGLSAFG